MHGFIVELNRNYKWNMDKFHFHSHFEILLSLTDAGSFWIDENSYDLRCGSMILLSPYLLHRSNAAAEVLYQRYILRFSPEYIASMSSNKTNLTSCFQKGHYVHQLFDTQLVEFVTYFQRCSGMEEGFGADLRANIAFVELMLYVCELVGCLEPEPSMVSQDLSRLEPVLQYIKMNLSGPLTLDDIAKQAYLSKHYLCNIFKRTTGFSVGEYIINSRILLAQQYLRDGFSVQRSGEQSGFSNNSHFIRTFHTMVGCSPGKYAQRYK